MDGSDSVSNGDVSYRFTHDVKAGLSLRWAHMGFFCLIDAFMFHFNEPRLEKIAQLMYFNTNTSFMHFMFKTLHISGTGALVGVCFVFLLLTVILEASKCLTFYLHAKLKQHPLTYGQTGRSIQNDRSPLFSAIMIPSSIERIKRQRIRFHLGGFTLHIFNLLLGYFIMLAIMTYNVYILIAVILGSGLGHFIFGAFTAMFYAKFERLNKQLYEDEDRDTLVTDDNNDTIMTDGSHHI